VPRRHSSLIKSDKVRATFSLALKSLSTSPCSLGFEKVAHQPATIGAVDERDANRTTVATAVARVGHSLSCLVYGARLYRDAGRRADDDVRRGARLVRQP